MFGHEMFSSMAATPSASERIRETSTYSSSVVPQTLTMTVARRARSSGSFLVDEPADADALQADRVQHAGGRFDDPRRRMALALGEKQALDGDAAKRGEIDQVGVFDAVAEAAARRDERVLQRQRADGDGEVQRSTLRISSAGLQACLPWQT